MSGLVTSWSGRGCGGHEPCMDMEIRYRVTHELAAEQNTESLLIINPLSIRWIVQQFICRDHKSLAKNISTFHLPVWHLCVGNVCLSPKSNSSAAPVYHQSGKDSVFRTITKWVYCHNSLKHWEQSDGDMPGSVFSCMSSIQFTAIQQKTGKEKNKTLAPEQEDILKAEVFLNGPGLSSSSGTCATLSPVCLQWEPKQHQAGFGPDERAAGGRGEKQSCSSAL